MEHMQCHRRAQTGITLTGSQRRALARLVRAGAHRATSGDAREDRARRRRGTIDRADRGVAAGVRGHRAQVAPPLVRGTGGGVAARSPTESLEMHARKIMQLAQLNHTGGLRALESHEHELHDPLLRRAVHLIVDMQHEEEVRAVVEHEFFLFSIVMRPRARCC